MARIPTRAGSRELPSAPNQMPSVRMSAAPNAGDLGANARVGNEGARRDLSSALDHFSSAVEQIERRKDNTSVLTALAEAQKATAAQQAELAGRKGAFAAGATKDTSKWFDESYETFAGGLGNERQKRAFDAEWRRLRVNGEVYASKHEVVENRAAMIDAATATVAGAIELAAANPSDKDALAVYRDQVLVGSQNAAAAEGHKAGSSPALLVQLKNLSALHETVLSAIVKDDPKAAEEYLKTNAGEMNASTKERATKLVETSSRLREAQTFADMAQAKGMTEQEAISEARKNYEGEAEKDVVAEVKVRFSETAAARERQQRTAADEAWKIIEQKGTLSAVDPVILNAMDGRDIAAIRRSIEAGAESRERRAAAAESRAYTRESRQFQRETRLHTIEQRERAEKTRITSDAYDAARKMMFTDPEGFKKTDWRRSNDILSFEQIQSLRQLQEKPVVKDFLTYEQQLGRATATMDKEDKPAFQMAADAAIRAEMDRTGKDLSQEERQKIINRMELDLKVNRSWLPDKSIKGYEVTPENADRVYIPGMPDLPPPAVQAVLGGVPKEAIQDLVEKFKARGVAPTSDLLIKQYQFENRKK